MTKENTDKLIPHPIREPIQVELMRQIFNAIRSDMETISYIPEISEQKQKIWWTSLDHSKVKAFLYTPVDEPWYFVAFSVVQKKGDFTTPMFGVVPAAHGRGYGREIIKHYLEVANGPLAGSQRKDNGAIRHLNQELGWQIVGETEEAELLYHSGIIKNDPRQEEIYEEILRYHGVKK